MGLKNKEGTRLIAKTWFPHGYNIPDNYGKLRNSLPDKDDYYYKSFLKSKRIEFDAYYDIHKNDPFHLSNEAIVYCFNDVEIVDGTTDFIDNFFKEHTQIEVPIKKKDGTYEKNEDGSDKKEIRFDQVFRHCSTMPSACIRLLRIMFLKRKTVPIIPEGGYNKNGKQSEIALKYLR